MNEPEPHSHEQIAECLPSPASTIIEQASILMVDDEPLNMEVLQVHLEQEGYRHFSRWSIRPHERSTASANSGLTWYCWISSCRASPASTS